MGRSAMMQSAYARGWADAAPVDIQARLVLNTHYARLEEVK